MKIHSAIPTLLLLLAASCATPTPPPQSAQASFFAALTSHCGKAYAGGLVSDQQVDADMRGRPMVMHVRECSAERITIPFHIQNANGNWDRSRTWLVTRTAAGLRLKHDHRHEDGSSDKVTLYGGDTASQGSARMQEFLVDADSIAMFKANNAPATSAPASINNVWRIEVAPKGTANARYIYQLTRANRLFRVEFDLTKPVLPPPAAWGWR